MPKSDCDPESASQVDDVPRHESLELQKFALDAEIRRREIVIKEREAARKTGVSAGTATVAAGIIALLSAVLGARITASSSESVASNRSTIEMKIEASKQAANSLLERQRFESTLILEAIKTPRRTDAIRNLKFFVNAGFVDDSAGKIAALNDVDLPSISEPSSQDVSKAMSATGRIFSVNKAGDSEQCNGVAIARYYIITASFCASKDRRLSFAQKEKSYDVDLISIDESSKLSILKVRDGKSLDNFVNTTNIRYPISGESIYLVYYNFKGVGQMQSCKIISIDVQDLNRDLFTRNSFGHSCKTDQGSAGAVVIAVNDNALLGIHYAAAPGGEMEVASNLGNSIHLLSGIVAMDTGLK